MNFNRQPKSTGGFSRSVTHSMGLSSPAIDSSSNSVAQTVGPAEATQSYPTLMGGRPSSFRSESIFNNSSNTDLYNAINPEAQNGVFMEELFDKKLPANTFQKINSFLELPDVRKLATTRKCLSSHELRLENKFKLRSSLLNLRKMIADSQKAGRVIKNYAHVRLDRQITDNDLVDAIQNGLLDAVQHLDLSHCANITEKGLQHLGSLERLSNLNLDWCTATTDDALRHLNNIPNLKNLSLQGCYLLVDGLQNISQCSKLTDINLKGCNHLSDVSLQHLGQLPNIERVLLAGRYNISDDGVRGLVKALKIKDLRLEGCESITDLSLQILNTLPELNKLNLKRCTRVTDDGIANLANHKQLTHLNLNGCIKITDRGLQHLPLSKNLTHLNLGFCYLITDNGLAHLTHLTKLVDLNLFGCPKITFPVRGLPGTRDPN